jgi:hypothetical protein
MTSTGNFTPYLTWLFCYRNKELISHALQLASCQHQHWESGKPSGLCQVAFALIQVDISFHEPIETDLLRFISIHPTPSTELRTPSRQRQQRDNY